MSKKGMKAKVIRESCLTRPTLDKIMAGGDFKVSTLEKVADALGISVSYLFDEDPHIVTTTGDFSPGSVGGNATVNIGDAVLAERVKSLEALLTEKDERIADLKERIDELRKK